MKSQNERKEKEKNKGYYTFLLEFQIKDKQDCKKLFAIIKQHKKNILKGVYSKNKK